MYFAAIIYTLVAWIAGLFLDIIIDMVDPAGFFSFRILLPILAMGFCILKSINDKGDKTN